MKPRKRKGARYAMPKPTRRHGDKKKQDAKRKCRGQFARLTELRECGNILLSTVE